MKEKAVLSRGRLLAIGVATTLAAFGAGAAAVPAYAGVASGNVGFYTVAGNQYRNYATIVTSTNSARASTNTGPDNFTAPAGWVGSRGRLFTSGGALSCEGGNVYSSTSMVKYQYLTGTSCTRSYGGTWYSYGVSLGWNGSGYQSF